ncbi:hypothetical protein Drorol1_Dr00006992 [Drosera rotundifolia]
MGTATPRQEVFCCSCLRLILLVVVVVAGGAGVVSGQSIVRSLPGYSGDLPFKLETGYIGVGELEEVQVFYYFIESGREPTRDPLLLWLNGGPGCSGLSSILFDIGPLRIDVEAYNGSLPSLVLNPHSWTKVANVLFVDQPVGTGFSYATIGSGYSSSDTQSSHQLYTFLRKWITYHPRFISNPLYVGGNSYAGITVPLLTQHILDGLEKKLQPQLNLVGYVLGNPATDDFIDANARVPLAHRISLISDDIYKNASLYCHDDFVNVNFKEALCLTTLQEVAKCLIQINLVQILEPQCAFAIKRRKEMEWDVRAEEAKTVEYLLSATTLSPPSKLPELNCRSFGYMLSRKWTNDIRVLEALNVRVGTVRSWVRCAETLPSYTKDVSSTVALHQSFTGTDLRALIFSGDHDLTVPYTGTLKWIKSLGLAVSDQWRTWYVNGQVAGYTTKFKNDSYQLTFAIFKGAGNPAPEYQMHLFIATFCWLFFPTFLLVDVVASQSVLDTLPGYVGKLPFVLETGYIGVGGFDEVQLFYFFVESERDAKSDPLLLWLTGGPGCSGFSGLVYEIGPLSFQYSNFDGQMPSFLQNNNSWTKVANIIFFDAPVGTGFSYGTTTEAYRSNDTLTAAHIYEFLYKWLRRHSDFFSNPLYIAGDSYSGIVVPLVVQNIIDGNEKGQEPKMTIKGYILGNPYTEDGGVLSSRMLYAHRVSLISDETFQLFRLKCEINYSSEIMDSNDHCAKAINTFHDCTDSLFSEHVLEPKCSEQSAKSSIVGWDQTTSEKYGLDFWSFQCDELSESWCRKCNYVLSSRWANDKVVQAALQVRERTVEKWLRCNETLSYKNDVKTAINYHQNFTKMQVRALVYSGDQDLVIPYVSTLSWIKSLNIPVIYGWRPWFLNGQVAGYTTGYANNHYHLVYATVKGAGHTAPEYKPAETRAMVERWLAYHPI